MKKVLSVLLAAAMVMGMGVSSMAANFSGSAVTSNVDVDDIVFKNVYVEDEDGVRKVEKLSGQAYKSLEAGDVLYFMVWENNNLVTSEAASTWKIKLKGNDYVEGAKFFWDEDKDITSDGALFVKVTLDDEIDHLEEGDVKFYFYIYDTKTDKESEYVKVNYSFEDMGDIYIDEDDLDWVLTVDKAAKYVYDEDSSAAYATVDFDGDAYAEFKMYPDETYTLSSEIAYNKALSKEYDADVEVITFRLGNVVNSDILFPASKDAYQVVAVVDGELVPVEAEYVKDYKFTNGAKATGYLVEDAEYTAYAVIDADVEIEVEEEAPVETPVEAEKANPETGAADFVGAAVAMAVVSVAAAGALALKK